MRQILSRAPVIDLPDLPALTAALTDRRFAAALAVAALSGFVRGFSGFGSALIYIPLIAAIYEPRIAAPSRKRMNLVIHDFEPGWDTYVERPGYQVCALTVLVRLALRTRAQVEHVDIARTLGADVDLGRVGVEGDLARHDR